MELDREWEKFRGGPLAASRDRLHVTMNRSGRIYMNANTHRLLGRPAAVNLYFNRAKDSIALAPAPSPRVPEVFPVTEMRTGHIVHASSFCRHFGIKLEKTARFAHADINEKGILILNLSSIVTVGGMKRPRKQK